MKNQNKIAELTRKLGIGSHASQGVKAILGKMPITLSDARADAVLAELQSRYDASEEGQAEAEKEAVKGYCEDVPMCPQFATKRSYQIR